mmetsp:Transcript_22293/g.42107  ORF Transcript_22293/g.42107 Transcript_22293/m.42107 type:complete len:118 (+) Transcript_22293:1-354(+)
MTNDVLAGIRIVKFYAWERPFGEEIEAVREEELKALTSLTLVMLVGFSAILFAAPIVQIMLVFATFTLTQEAPLSASVAFTTVALFVSFFLRYGCYIVCRKLGVEPFLKEPTSSSGS